MCKESWKLVQLDCSNGHVCTGMSFPLISAARLLLHDVWNVVARDHLALIDSTANPVPFVRQGTLVYLTPTTIPHAAVDCRCGEIGSELFI